MRTACRTARKVLNVARDNVKVRLDFTTVKMIPQDGDFLMKRIEGTLRVFSLERSIVGDFVVPFRILSSKKK